MGAWSNPGAFFVPKRVNPFGRECQVGSSPGRSSNMEGMFDLTLGPPKAVAG